MILHSLHLFPDKIFVHICLIENGLPVVHLAQVTYNKERSTMEVPNLLNLNARFLPALRTEACMQLILVFENKDCKIVQKN